MSSSSSSVRFNYFVRGEAENKVFPVEIDNNLTVENLKDSIKIIRQDLHQVNFG